MDPSLAAPSVSASPKNSYAAALTGTASPARKDEKAPSPVPVIAQAALSQPSSPSPASLVAISAEELRQLKETNAQLAERLKIVEAALANKPLTPPASPQKAPQALTPEQTAEQVYEASLETFKNYRALQDDIDRLRNRCRVLMDNMSRYTDLELLETFQPLHDQYKPLFEKAQADRTQVEKAIVALRAAKKPEKPVEGVDKARLGLINIECDYDNTIVRFENCRDHMNAIIKKLNSVSWGKWWKGEKAIGEFKEVKSPFDNGHRSHHIKAVP